MDQKKQPQLSLAIAIIIAGFLIAGAIILTKKMPQQNIQPGTPLEEALATADAAGIKERDIKACIENRDMQGRVARDADNAATLGVNGTPYNVVIGPNDQRFAVPGAFPIEFFEKVIAIMESGSTRSETAFASDDVEGIYGFVMQNDVLPTITGDKLAMLLPVDETDHVRGDRNAQFMIVEYSDLECPFCQLHHDTMKKLQEKYGSKIAWTYRHLPLAIHDGSQTKAEASECVAAAKGNDSFWQYIDEDFASLGK